MKGQQQLLLLATVNFRDAHTPTAF